ncbi:MAG: hypothetical protein ABSD56_00645 [Bryobacteraceae bacterium]|jgi:hypothetical protein
MPANYPLTPVPQYAVSGGPNVYRVLSPASQADLANQLIAALKAANWTWKANITNGQRLRGASPQGYLVWVEISWFAGMFGRNPVQVQLRSAILGSTAVGFAHTLDYQAGCTYQIAANPAGFFISRPGVNHNIAGSSCCVGIPFMDSGCGFGNPPVTEVWWSMGDMVGGFTSLWDYSECPRVNLNVGSQLGWAQCGCYNGTVVSGSRDQIGIPQILRISSGADDDDGLTFANSAKPVWVDGVPILYPAFVAWGDTADSGVKIRGQVYDAMCRSKKYDMDTAESWDGYDWINYTDQDFFGSLWILKGTSPAPPSGTAINVAY